MFDNPFTPLFGGKPDFFFGRDDVLGRFDRALDVRGSEDRSLFITGARGSGKTALVEQLSMRAEAREWTVIDINAENALNSLLRRLNRFAEISSSVDPSVGVNVFGSGVTVRGGSVTKTERFGADDIDALFMQTCEKSRHGVFVSIDEIQKVPLDDVSKICGAFQMASRKGHDVIIVVAGLPYAYNAVVQHDGCTYMRRSVHEELGLFSPAEVRDAFARAFEEIDRFSVDHDAFDMLVKNSYGHPYMMQLLGYHLVEYAGSFDPIRTVETADVEAILPVAFSAYERRSLRPLVEAMPLAERSYARAAAQVADDGGLSETGDIVRLLGKTHQQVAPARKALIDQGIIVAEGRGRVRFCIPRLRAYLVREPSGSPATRYLDEWGI